MTTTYSFLSIPFVLLCNNRLIQNKSLKNYTVEIFDNTGKKITSLINQNNSVAISLSKYMSGLYTLRVISNQNVYTQNIIVTK